MSKPWRNDGILDDHVEVQGEIVPMYEITGEHKDNGDHCVIGYVFDEENANLVALAPEMIEILQEMVATSNTMPPPSGDPRNVFGQGISPLREWRYRMDNAWDRARNLVDKHLKEVTHVTHSHT